MRGKTGERQQQVEQRVSSSLPSVAVRFGRVHPDAADHINALVRPASTRRLKLRDRVLRGDRASQNGGGLSAQEDHGKLRPG
jgi:hypothetical protein